LKTERLHLLRIRDAISRIDDYAAAGRTEFFAKTHWQDAIIRQLEIVAEACKRLSPSLRESAPNVPWRRICGLRDVLIHNHMGLDLDAVWVIVESGVPSLKEAVEANLSKET